MKKDAADQIRKWQARYDASPSDWNAYQLKRAKRRLPAYPLQEAARELCGAESDPFYNPVLGVLSLLESAFDVSAASQLSGIPAELLTNYLSNIKKSTHWQNEKICLELDETESPALSLMLVAMVASGELITSSNPLIPPSTIHFPAAPAGVPKQTKKKQTKEHT